MRWKLRSAPERSTFMATPGYLASKALATFSASGRSTEVYQVTLPSFFAASISSGVIFCASGGAPRTGVTNEPATAIVEAASTWRRVSFLVMFRFLPSMRGIVRRQPQPDLACPARYPASGGAVTLSSVLSGERDRIVARRAEKDLPADNGMQHDCRHRRRRQRASISCWRTETEVGSPAVSGRPVVRQRAAADGDVARIDRLAGAGCCCRR